MSNTNHQASGTRHQVPGNAVERPWGWYVTTLEMPGYKTKILCVNPGQRLSLQSHAQRKEIWAVVRGSGLCTVDKSLMRLSEESVVSIPVGAVHRVENPSSSEPLVISEVQIGERCEEDDIVRYSDDYGRVL